MKRKMISDLLHARRAKLDITGEQAAKKLRLSVNYYRLIESGYPTHVSERVASLFVRKLGVPKHALRAALKPQNDRARKEARKWVKKAA